MTARAGQVDTYEWMRLVRRCCFTAPTNLVALTLATYANQDGTNIFPGVDRLTRVTGLSERSVRGAMKTLRDVGLIERTRAGSSMGRRALTDVHALAFPVDLADRLKAARVELLTPKEDREEKEAPAGDAAVPAVSPAGGADDLAGTPAPHAGTPAGGAGTPAGGAKNTGTTCTPPTQVPTNYQLKTNRELTNVGTSRPREVDADNVISLEPASGPAQAVAAHQQLRDTAEHAPHCGDPSCDPESRWRNTRTGRERCPECHPLSILQRVRRPQLAVVAGAR